MSIRKIQLNLISNKNYLKFLTRYSSNDKKVVDKPLVSCDKAKKSEDKPIVSCDKNKTCTPSEVDHQHEDKKDICVYSPCPQGPCPVEPCKPDLPSPEVFPEEGAPSKTRTNVIVVGAGVAGLSCARRLVQAGFHNTLVLEAEERPGGRIQSGWLKDTVIEKGSDWCCDTCNHFKNHVVQLGVRSGMMKIPLSGVDPSQGLLQQTDNTPLPLPISFMAWNHLTNIVKEAECISRRVPRTQSDLSEYYIGIRLHQLLHQLPNDMAMTGARLLLGLASYMTPSLRKVVTDSFGSYASAVNLRVPLGYLGALAPIITDIGKQRILYKKKVLQIRWGTVLAEQHPRAVLRCKDGTTYHADYVIITCPLGVLKENYNTMFCPPLSQAKSNAILSISTRHKGKVFLEYDQPFWVWRDDKIQKDFKDGELSKRGDFTRGMTSIEELPGSEHVLVATIHGDAVEEMEKLTNSEANCYLRCFLQEWLGNSCIPQAKNVVRTNWTTNSNFQGAESYIDESICESETCRIKDPLPKGGSELPPVLYFAGEHTCPRDLIGTVRGAMISGIREAEQVIAAINETAFEPHPCVKEFICA